MYFLLSGEGATDLGVGEGANEISEGDRFKPGPLALVLAKIIEDRHGYSPAETGHWGFASETALEARRERGYRFAGKKHGRETTAYYRNARALARIAAEKGREAADVVVAVLFRDADGTCSAGRGEWESKRRSMLDGFAAEGFETGVPMVPKPKSEAWLLCALRDHRHGCDSLEGRPGNDRSPNSLKAELADLLSKLGRSSRRDDLRAMVEDGSIDWRNIKMSSFQAFLDRLAEVIDGPPDRDSALDR